jgi:hypothetical protein
MDAMNSALQKILDTISDGRMPLIDRVSATEVFVGVSKKDSDEDTSTANFNIIRISQVNGFVKTEVSFNKYSNIWDNRKTILNSNTPDETIASDRVVINSTTVGVELTAGLIKRSSVYVCNDSNKLIWVNSLSTSPAKTGCALDKGESQTFTLDENQKFYGYLDTSGTATITIIEVL